eukprot:3822951-Ditylum_brightwellii.AAC.1
MLQETWLSGQDILTTEGYSLVCSGLPPESQSKCGSQGVAIILSPQVMATWQYSGIKITQVSAQAMAIHLIILDDQNREVGLVLISTYAPISATEEEEWYTF